MKETGRISNIDGRTVTIRGGELAACFGCMNQECKSNQRVFIAVNRYNFVLSVGQFVEVETVPASSFIQFLQAVLPPLVGFLLFYVLVFLIFPGLGAGIRAAFGFLGLFLGGFGFYRFRKKYPSPQGPAVIRILGEN